MKVAVFGAGYVGLVTGVCLASLGHEVACIEADPLRLSQLQAGACPIHEPGLPERLQAELAAGRFRATGDPMAGLSEAEVALIAVGTPDRGGSIDLSAVQAVSESLGTYLAATDRYLVVVVKSTVVPTTTGTRVRGWIEGRSGKRAGRDFGLAMNPEFLREGFGVEDFLEPDRIVMGCLDDRSAAVLERLYGAFSCPKLRVGLVDAELAKYASNALLATAISFSNELFGLCEAIPGAHGQAVLEILHMDGRLSPLVGGQRVRPGLLSYLMGGIGYGGSCLPKDLHALTAWSRQEVHPLPLLEAVVQVNEARARQVVARLAGSLGPLQGRRVAVLGLAFKPGTDDGRNSPALPLLEALLDQGCTVSGWDPLVRVEGLGHLAARVAVHRSPELALAGVEAAVVATGWPELRLWDWPGLLARMARPLLLDGRQALGGLAWPEGTEYQVLGTMEAEGT